MYFRLMGFSFRKKERLSKRKHIQELFEKGSSFYLHPLKVYFRPNLDSDSNQVLISVSARNFKRAVDRNLIKRRMREAYRLNKHKLPSNHLALAFIYSAKEILSFQGIEQKMLMAFGRLQKHMKSSIDSTKSPE